MDRTSVCGTDDPGSIPGESTQIEYNNCMLEQNPGTNKPKEKTIYKTELPPHFKNPDGTTQQLEFTHTQEFPSGIILKNKEINQMIFVKQMSSRNQDFIETIGAGTHPLSELEIPNEEELVAFLTQRAKDTEEMEKMLAEQKELQTKIIY